MMCGDKIKRSAIAGAGLLLSGLLAACGGGTAPQGDGSPGQPETRAPSGPKINDPKDAAAVPRCSLLPPEAATSLGLSPQGEERANQIDPKAPSECAYTTPDGRDSVALTPLSDRSIQEYYDNKSKYPDFQQLDIAGHPAVRANQGDPKSDGFCDFFLATKDGQVLASQSYSGSPQQNDPCALSQKALESSVPALPAAK
ncbi:hypothetical protein GCM10025787_19360 [Saccharopolyspora rosea]|uniref:DUF3558 domain-containing protein n=1 Tax=Saccharopolyspora rosea TaxID=524884 RepID=A0ABW3G0M2_9PSEU